MGTFHHGKGELHGITVVVDTYGPRVYVGRCEEMDEKRIVLVDADEHQESTGGKSKAEYLREAAKRGVWKKHDMISLPRSQVASIRRLAQVAADA
ncbi:MAG: hypothetical protein ACREID_08275 [Planctomycetota bacterium]